MHGANDEPDMQHQSTPEEDHSGHAMHEMESGNPAVALLMQHASGTAMNPASAPMEMIGTRRGEWDIMLHGLGNLVYTEQTGLRGETDTFSTNWLMGMAHRKVGKGTLMLRSMLSFEPATISSSTKFYPMLFQTGETANDRPIVDGQHPHEFFMELGAQYVYPLKNERFLTVYVAPVGDPAMGPVAFPHRTSAMEIPQATLSHHYHDSTHIALSVVTLGIGDSRFRLEASGFHGAEPDEDRWDLNTGSIDSWAARFSWTPNRNWIAQVSTAYLVTPESYEPGDQERLGISVAYHRPLAGGYWSSSAIWGGVYKESHDQTVHALTLESTLNLFRRHYLTTRYEKVDKDSIFPHIHPPGSGIGERVPLFEIEAYTVGYTFDFLRARNVHAGLGVNYTWYEFPELLGFFYGEDPDSIFAFLRLRTAGQSHSGHH
ncbi:MAG TPA: hypothetical protein VMS12_06340 [Thermoanaerobaculia bacterium]|nr:hypothetical protein [Thermoanaerobaculia bacterium]